MQYQGTLIAVSDMEKTKHFYETVMEQKIMMDFGVHVAFGGFSLQSNYDEIDNCIKNYNDEALTLRFLSRRLVYSGAGLRKNLRLTR